MTPSQYQRLNELFEALCDGDAEARAQGLAAARAEDAAIADELVRMLAVDGGPSLAIGGISQLDTLATWAGDTACETGRLVLPERYVDLGRLGVGGMGEVRRVRDLKLSRVLAMKVISNPLPALEARFIDEAQVLAQLQHPGIVPIHDLGQLADGRAFFTMREVRGVTWHHELKRDREKPDWLRGQIEILRDVCRAVAFAHHHRVVHRDLKPENVMIGQFGEVMVLDWGLARLLAGSEVQAQRQDDDVHNQTAEGTVMGTPMYMAPEQAMGQIDQIRPSTDVYALGAILYQLLAGRMPFPLNVTPVDVVTKRPPPIDASIRSTFGPLVSLCERSMALEPVDRPANASVLLDALSEWLSGAADRAEALELLARAEAMETTVAARRAQVAALSAEAAALLADVAPSAPVEDKAPGWAKEDEAAAAKQALRLAQEERLQLVWSALNRAPDLREAHALLATHHRLAAEAAEAARDPTAAAVHVEAVRRHDDGEHAEWLAGQGWLSLTSEPPDAKFSIAPWVAKQRRLVAGEAVISGVLPCSCVELPAGSYRVRVTLGGRAADLPVALGRGERLTAHVRLPPTDVLGRGLCFVPGGAVRRRRRPRRARQFSANHRCRAGVRRTAPAGHKPRVHRLSQRSCCERAARRGRTLRAARAGERWRRPDVRPRRAGAPQSGRQRPRSPLVARRASDAGELAWGDGLV